MTRGSAAEAGGFLREALREPIPEGGIRIVTIPAPAVDPTSLLDPGERPAFFWAMPGGATHVGLGAAHLVGGHGPERFRMVEDAAAHLWARTSTMSGPGAPAPTPRLFGGFSFLPEPLPRPWESFGGARFVLPRLLYAVEGQNAFLSFAIGSQEVERTGTERLESELERFLDRLTARPTTGSTSAHPEAFQGRPAPDTAASREEWARAVESIRRRITAGVGEKVVAARSRELTLSPPGDARAVLRRLGEESATAARFAFRFGAATFVGATPERLVGRTGDEVRTEALAGTVPAGRPEEEQRLLDSMKDEVEHRYVVQAIAEALEPLCSTLERPPQPRIQRLRHVVHLQTPFVGRLREPVHLLRLVERLHPTPAVGGWPREQAMEWIREEEPGSRGWYAAPIGWFDARGDGEFGVALRSALLRDGHASLYAGAGIVRDSDAEAEFRETEVKLRTMMHALGVEA